ncbi:protein RESPONSE TO LOW SULFUR 3-like [Dendrobium catenatum]|uniref:Uncharacterized protein n=1 Tax=Dendrobium catenatum TaxID=906689 RepID=A0A2I0WG60_9ASPA|nr:protein RESPONSE TO LOW SULFUR 3-like [Dendrobium catenatum]PKU74656.1 hypothetical protein MA16_Dca004847 [Dendrobium catenatum]
MAPAIGIAIPDPMAGKMGLGFRRVGLVQGVSLTEAEELQRRNLELEREVRERRESEEELRLELERTKERLMAVEEAEERLCTQLGELEAEAIEQAREYNRRIRTLSDHLAKALRRIEAGGERVVAVD